MRQRAGLAPVIPTDPAVLCRVLIRRFQLREVALRVAVVPELFLEDGVDALVHRVRAVLEHVDRSCEVGRRNRCEVVAKACGAIRTHGERFRDRRRQVVVEAGPREVDGAGVRQPDRVEAFSEDRHGEPLVHREDEVSQRLDEGPLVVDRLMQRVFGKSLRPGDRLRPLVFERRPRVAHALRVRSTEHRREAGTTVRARSHRP